jgi:hypothetical protein
MKSRWDWACFSSRTPALPARAVKGRLWLVGVREGVSSSGQVAGTTASPPMRARQATRAGIMPRQGRIRSLRHSMGDKTSPPPRLLRPPDPEVKYGNHTVRSQAQTTRTATPQRTAERRRVAPTPMMEPAMVCVVLTGNGRGLPDWSCVAASPKETGKGAPRARGKGRAVTRMILQPGDGPLGIATAVWRGGRTSCEPDYPMLLPARQDASTLQDRPGHQRRHTQHDFAKANRQGHGQSDSWR